MESELSNFIFMVKLGLVAFHFTIPGKRAMCELRVVKIQTFLINFYLNLQHFSLLISKILFFLIYDYFVNNITFYFSI